MRLTHTIAAIAAPTLAVTALLTAAPALAKSDVAITVSAHQASVGKAVRVTGSGDDDAMGRRTQVCVQMRSAHRWHELRCSRPTSDASQGVSVTSQLIRRAPAVVLLRARLYDFAPHSRHGVAEQTTQPVTVSFTG